MNTNKLILSAVVAWLGTACADGFFEVQTTDAMTADDAQQAAEADPAKVAAYVEATYNLLVQYDAYNNSEDAFGYMAVLHAADLLSEDIALAALAQQSFDRDYLHSNREWTYERTRATWQLFYTVISNINNALRMTSAASASKEILAARGQALALRAFSYFYLIQLYQHVYPLPESAARPGVPLYYAGNEGKESVAGRASVGQILAQIEDDLTTAVTNLKGWTRASKNQIDYAVANGLLARYYLLAGQWDNAIAAAQEARKEYGIMPASALSDGFMGIENPEWMWGFDHNANTTTRRASFFSHISNLTGGYAGLGYAPRLIDRRLYESIPGSDARKRWFQPGNPAATFTPPTTPDANTTAWQLPYANLKFGYDGAFTMDYVYMRAAEMALIEAEALAHQGKGAAAAAVLKELLSQRDPDWNAGSVTVDDVWQQRRIELWGEGFAAFDLKRLNKGIDRNYDGSNHYLPARLAIPPGDARWTYSIPQDEMVENPNIQTAVSD